MQFNVQSDNFVAWNISKLTLVLTDRDRAVLCAIYHQARLPVRRIAAQLGMREHSVRYSVEKLREHGVIRFHPFIDIYALGYVQYELYVSLASQSSAKSEQFVKALVQSPQVAWVGHYGGRYQYAFTVCARRLNDVAQFLDELSTSCRGAIFQKSLSLRKYYTEFRFKNLIQKKVGPEELRFGLCTEENDIDEVDHLILRTMCRREHASDAELARELELSPPTLRYRLNVLEKKRIILGYTCLVDFSALNMHQFLLLLQVRGMRPALAGELLNFSRKHPDCIYFSEAVGSWDFKIGVNVGRPEKSVQIVQQLYDRFGADLLAVDTLSAFRYCKVARYPF